MNRHHNARIKTGVIIKVIFFVLGVSSVYKKYLQPPHYFGKVAKNDFSKVCSLALIESRAKAS